MFLPPCSAFPTVGGSAMDSSGRKSDDIPAIFVLSLHGGTFLLEPKQPATNEIAR